MRDRFGWALVVVGTVPDRVRGRLQPRRWLVERIVACVGRCRRLAKHAEARAESAEVGCSRAMSHLMLPRLAPPLP